VTATGVFPATGTFRLGELTMVRNGEGAVVRGPAPNDESVVADPDAVRELVSQDASGRYRPLAGARSLPSGWQVECPTSSELGAIIDAIYPLALAHLEQWREGTLRVVSLADTLSRQTARYAVSNDLTSASRDAAADALCGYCVKQPLWRRPSDPAPVDVPLQVIPCPEPCSVLVSLCREAALWEKKMPPATTIDPTVSFADFEAPGNEVREDCLARMRASSGTRGG
jgi:hypothetical protein